VTDYLDASAVQGIIEEMPEQYADCRAFRHQVKPENSVENSVYGYRHNTYLCACGFRKHELTTTTWPFRILDSWPEYPEGYVLKGMGRLDSDGQAVVKAIATQRHFKTKKMPVREARQTPPPRSKAKEALGIEVDEQPRLRVVETVRETRKRKAS